jgi:1-acyl-sn-glycerol-3-phosphate acyltransferase
VLGTLATGGGTLYIERAQRKDAMRMVKDMAKSLREGDVLAVFPEGTTGDGIGMLPFHANLIQGAIEGEAPIQPLALQFVDAHGISMAARYIDDDTLLGSVWSTLNARGLKAVVHFGTPQVSEGRDRRQWAAALQQDVLALKTACTSRG